MSEFRRYLLGLAVAVAATGFLGSSLLRPPLPGSPVATSC